MALLVRLRRALLRSSSIPNCCSFSPIPSDSSHLINLSKTIFPAASRLENPSIRPNPSKHDRRSPHTCSIRFLSDSHYRQHETKIPKDEIDSPTSPKPSPEEMIETFFQNLAEVMGSVEDTKVIEELSHKLKKTCKEMIGQLKGPCRRQKRRVEGTKVIEEMSDKFEKNGLRKTEQLKGDKCRNKIISTRPLSEYESYISAEDLKMIGKLHEKLTKYVKVLKKLKGDKCLNAVIIPRPPSPLPEYENHVSVKDLEMIVEMLEKLTKYIKVLKKLKVRHAFAPCLSPFCIDSKDNKTEGATRWYEIPRRPALLPEYKNFLSVEDLEMIDEMHEELTKYVKELKKLKDATCWNKVLTPRQLPLLPEYKNHLSAEDLEMIDEMPEQLTKYVKVLKKLKAVHGVRPFVLKHTGTLIGGPRQPFTTEAVDVAKLKRDLYGDEGLQASTIKSRMQSKPAQHKPADSNFF